MGIQESWNEKENIFLRNKVILLLFFSVFTDNRA